jgi:hypothetical protein
MNNPFIYIIAAVLFIIVVVAYRSSDYIIVRKKLRKAERKQVADFEDGDTGKIVGEVVLLGRTLIAPLSGRKCAYYHVVVEQQKNYRQHPNTTELINEEKSGDVILKVGKDYVLVDTRLVYTYVVKDMQFESGFMKEADEAMEKYLAKHGHKSVGLLGLNKDINYKEGVLEEGEKVVVFGKGQWKTKSQLRLNVPAERILHLRMDGQEAVYLSDDGSMA